MLMRSTVPFGRRTQSGSPGVLANPLGSAGEQTLLTIQACPAQQKPVVEVVRALAYLLRLKVSCHVARRSHQSLLLRGHYDSVPSVVE